MCFSFIICYIEYNHPRHMGPRFKSQIDKFNTGDCEIVYFPLVTTFIITKTASRFIKLF